MKMASFTVPPVAVPKPVAVLSDEVTRLAGLRAAEQARSRTLVDDLARAREADRAAYAAALRAGHDDPGTPETHRVEAEIADSKRRLAALEVAVVQAETELLAVID